MESGLRLRSQTLLTSFVFVLFFFFTAGTLSKLILIDVCLCVFDVYLKATAIIYIKREEKDSGEMFQYCINNGRKWGRGNEDPGSSQVFVLPWSKVLMERLTRLETLDTPFLFYLPAFEIDLNLILPQLE